MPSHTLTPGRLSDFITESNRIEGIIRPPTDVEIAAATKFLALDTLTVGTLCSYVNVIANASLRDQYGMNVRVGSHIPMYGGPEVRKALEVLLEKANISVQDYKIHKEYENLHPFTDGNGRSGRMIWLWMREKRGQPSILGFLHHWYYQSLGEK